MKCEICGQRNVDGATDDAGEYICIDCWADGEAAARGKTAVSFVPAAVSYPVHYPAETVQKFLDGCNGIQRK